MLSVILLLCLSLFAPLFISGDKLPFMPDMLFSLSADALSLAFSLGDVCHFYPDIAPTASHVPFLVS